MLTTCTNLYYLFNICVKFFMSLACIKQFLVIIGQNNLPNIVPVATGIVVGNAGVVYTTVTGAGVVTPRQI